MGVIRGGLLIIVGILLFLGFLAGNILLTLDLSLNYDNVKAELGSVVRGMAETDYDLTNIINEKFGAMESYCQNYSEYVFSEEGQTFVIPCDVIAQGSDAVIEQSINDFVEKAYYDDYDCNFWNCFSQTGQPFFLISKKAKDYWHSKFYFVLIASLVLIGLMFLLVEHKPNLLIIVGGLLTVSALLFRKLNGLFSYIDESFLEFTNLFFARSYGVFLISIIIGLVILGLGIIFRFLTFDFIKKKFSKKDVQEIVKKEVSKSKEEVKEKIKDKKKKT